MPPCVTCRFCVSGSDFGLLDSYEEVSRCCVRQKPARLLDLSDAVRGCEMHQSVFPGLPQRIEVPLECR